jgi:hypothetical protein
VPSQTRRTELDTLRDELIRSFQNPDNFDDTTPFFESLPESSARHNFLPSPITPLFELSDLPFASITYTTFATTFYPFDAATISHD